MAFVSAKCTNCGGELQLDDSLDKGYCMYCGSTIIIKDAIQNVKIEGDVSVSGIATVDNLIELLHRDIDNGKYRSLEYEERYKRAIELDPNNEELLRMNNCSSRNGLLYAFRELEEKSYTIPDDIVKIGDNAFSLSRNLESGANAFSFSKNLESIEFGERLKTIGNRAFSNCKNLREVKNAEGVESIGNEAFKDCENLVKIKFPISLKIIGYDILTGCTKLECIENYYFSEKNLINKRYDYYELDMSTEYNYKLKTITINSNVSKINRNMFRAIDENRLSLILKSSDIDFEESTFNYLTNPVSIYLDKNSKYWKKYRSIAKSNNFVKLYERSGVEDKLCFYDFKSEDAVVITKEKGNANKKSSNKGRNGWPLLIVLIIVVALFKTHFFGLTKPNLHIDPTSTEIPDEINVTEFYMLNEDTYGANVRNEPSLNSNIILQVSKEDKLQFMNNESIDEEGRVWILISVVDDNQEGWISKKILTKLVD